MKAACADLREAFNLRSELLGAGKFAEPSVKGSEGEMASSECDGEDKAVGEAELGVSTKVSESGGDDIGILNDQGLVIQE